MRRLLVPALITGALLAAAPGAALAAHRPGAHAAQQGPDETLDASDPSQGDKVGDALDLCTTLDNCSWVTDSVGSDYGPAQIIGDALYNCSSDEYAATAVVVTAKRAESTNVSESVSAKISLSFLGFAKTSAQFTAKSSQASTFSTGVTSTNDDEVPPGWKGWNQTRVKSGLVTGHASVTDGIHLIEVQNMDLTFPGYQLNTDQDDPIEYQGFRTPMSETDRALHCNAVDAASLAARHVPRRFGITLCRRGCATRRLRGTPPRRIRKGTARIVAAGHTYATGSVRRGHLRLAARHKLRSGARYHLRITQKGAQPTVTDVPVTA